MVENIKLIRNDNKKMQENPWNGQGFWNNEIEIMKLKKWNE